MHRDTHIRYNSNNTHTEMASPNPCQLSVTKLVTALVLGDLSCLDTMTVQQRDSPWPWGMGLRGKREQNQNPATLTRHAHSGHGAHTLAIMESIQVHLVFAPRLQVSHDGLPLLAPNTHHLGPPITVLVLDTEGVKVSLGDGPGEAQGVWGRCCDSQVSQERLLRGLWGLCAGLCGAGGLFLCS